MTNSPDATWDAPPGRTGSAAPAAIVLTVLTGWFLVVLAIGAAGVFEAGPSRPPLAVLAAIVLPPLLFLLLCRASDGIRAWALGLDPRLLTAMQGWRVIGAVFLVLYAYGMLPGLFAWPAGLGDVAVGLSAPFVLMAMITRAPGWQRRVLWLNVAGLVDFAAAVVTGVLSSNSALGFFASGEPTVSLGALPISLIPTFGVPLWIIIHGIALAQLRRMARADAVSRAPSSP